MFQIIMHADEFNTESSHWWPAHQLINMHAFLILISVVRNTFYKYFNYKLHFQIVFQILFWVNLHYFCSTKCIIHLAEVIKIQNTFDCTYAKTFWNHCLIVNKNTKYIKCILNTYFIYLYFNYYTTLMLILCMQLRWPAHHLINMHVFLIYYACRWVQCGTFCPMTCPSSH